MALLRAKLFELELEKQRRWAGLYWPGPLVVEQRRERPVPAVGTVVFCWQRLSCRHSLLSAAPGLPPLVACSEISARRKSQVGTGSRSEKIKTYNYKDTRMSGEGRGARALSSSSGVLLLLLVVAANGRLWLGSPPTWARPAAPPQYCPQYLNPPL